MGYNYERRQASGAILPEDYDFEPMLKKAREAIGALQEAKRLAEEIDAEMLVQIKASKTPENPSASPPSYRNAEIAAGSLATALGHLLDSAGVDWPDKLHRTFTKYLPR